MTETDKTEANHTIRTRKVLEDFALGCFSGVVVGVVFAKEMDLDLILIGMLGVPVSNSLFTNEYVSKDERVVGSIATYAGAVISSITYQLLKY